jgi:hypothetical protein
MLEAQLVRDAKHLLRIQENLGRLAFVRVNVSPVIRGTGRRRVVCANPDMVGMPDFLVWLAGGPVLSLEFKAGGNVQSVGQKAFEKRLRRVGHAYYVIRDMGELLTVLAQYGLSV